MKLIDNFIHEKPSGLLYHYTGAAGLIGILQNHELWATDHRHLNDRKEHRIGTRLLEEEFSSRSFEKRYRAVFDGLLAQTKRQGYFVLSFSERGDLLSQWRAYCPGGNGYSLGFAQGNPLFESAAQHQFNLIRCEYNPARQRKLCKYLIDAFVEGMVGSWHSHGDVKQRITGFMERYQWNLALALMMSAMKQEGFEEEREWRLVSQYPDESLYGVSFRPGRFGVTPYFELPIDVEKKTTTIDELVAGPNPNRGTVRAALELLLSIHGTKVGKLKVSRTPLRQ